MTSQFQEIYFVSRTAEHITVILHVNVDVEGHRKVGGHKSML